MRVTITGGAGFIGSNTAAHFLRSGNTVRIIDNFSRKGSVENAAWIKSIAKEKLEIIEADLRTDQKKMMLAFHGSDVIFHFAGQVAVTTSVEDPRNDFDNNLLATFNVLEAIRQLKENPILIYSSTNKVYGSLEDLDIIEKPTRFAFANLPYGVSEERCLDFHSPYGCSKGGADQYVRDYHRIYGMNTIVFRQSCIYGPRQFGIEDQGWVAWFLIALLNNKKITIYGNGKQVRDLLYIDDLIAAFELAMKHIDITKGQVYNIGGGSDNTLSVWVEFKPMLEKLFAKKIIVPFTKNRPGDQPIFIADIRKAKQDFGWTPKVSVSDGVSMLHKWVVENKKIFNLV